MYVNVENWYIRECKHWKNIYICMLVCIYIYMYERKFEVRRFVEGESCGSGGEFGGRMVLRWQLTG